MSSSDSRRPGSNTGAGNGTPLKPMYPAAEVGAAQPVTSPAPAVFVNILRTNERLERRWEMTARFALWIANAMTWLARLLLLAAAGFQLKNATSLPPPWLLLTDAILATVNLAFPLMMSVFRLQQRQEVHDSNARQYGILLVHLESNTITLDEAIARFTAIRKRPAEKVIRAMP